MAAPSESLITELDIFKPFSLNIYLQMVTPDFWAWNSMTDDINKLAIICTKCLKTHVKEQQLQ